MERAFSLSNHHISCSAMTFKGRVQEEEVRPQLIKRGVVRKNLEAEMSEYNKTFFLANGYKFLGHVHKSEKKGHGCGNRLLGLPSDG